jgi:lipopolysaccharide biosynthesis protein
MIFLSSLRKSNAIITTLLLILISCLIFNTSSHQDKEEFMVFLQGYERNTNQWINSDLIQYVYHQSEDADFNFRFFLKHALHEKADFVFVINGNSSLVEEIPLRPNIKVVIRENNCFDIGAHGDVLHQLNRNYSRIILMNASVRGPFLPRWANTCWSDVFFGKLNDEVKIVGTTANCDIIPHLQSMILAFDHVSIQLVLPLLEPCYTDIKDAIDNGEVQLTLAVLNAGYKADILMSKPWDWEHCLNPDTASHDLVYTDRYDGMNLHPFEVIFFKAKRFASDYPVILKHTEWMAQENYSSYDHCSLK